MSQGMKFVIALLLTWALVVFAVVGLLTLVFWLLGWGVFAR